MERWRWARLSEERLALITLLTAIILSLGALFLGAVITWLTGSPEAGVTVYALLATYELWGAIWGAKQKEAKP